MKKRINVEYEKNDISNLLAVNLDSLILDPIDRKKGIVLTIFNF